MDTQRMQGKQKLCRKICFWDSIAEVTQWKNEAYDYSLDALLLPDIIKL